MQKEMALSDNGPTSIQLHSDLETATTTDHKTQGSPEDRYSPGRVPSYKNLLTRRTL